MNFVFSVNSKELPNKEVAEYFKELGLNPIHQLPKQFDKSIDYKLICIITRAKTQEDTVVHIKSQKDLAIYTNPADLRKKVWFMLPNSYSLN